MHGRAIQCKHTHYSAVLSKVGKGRQHNVTGIPRFSRSAYVHAHKTLRMYGFSVQTWVALQGASLKERIKLSSLYRGLQVG